MGNGQNSKVASTLRGQHHYLLLLTILDLLHFAVANSGCGNQLPLASSTVN